MISGWAAAAWYQPNKPRWSRLTVHNCHLAAQILRIRGL